MKENMLGKKNDFLRMLGRTEGASAQRKISAVTDVILLKQLKDSKSYKKFGLSWEEVCSELGRSRSNVDEEIANIEAFGKELSESLNLLGLSRSEVRLLRGGINSCDVKVDGDMIMIGDTAVATSDKEGIAKAISALKSAKDAAEKALEKERKERADILKEEVKGVQLERDALIEQNKKLKADLGEREPVCFKHIDELSRIVANFSSKLRRLTLEGEPSLNREEQGRCFGLLKIMLGEVLDLNDLFQDKYGDE